MSRHRDRIVPSPGFAVALIEHGQPDVARSNTLRMTVVRDPADMVERVAMLRVSRETLASMLREHGEDDLAKRALLVSDDELARIRTLGAYYAFSDDAMTLGGSMGGTRALSLATIDVLEDAGRDLRRSRTERELESGRPDRFIEVDLVRDRELRPHAAERQIPADERKGTLDAVDPPETIG